jgi:glutamine amidotransferase
VSLTALVDYDAGNLHSAVKAFQRMGAETGARVAVTQDPQTVAKADRIVLPGDGAFPACRQALADHKGLYEAIAEKVAAGTPFLGICVGMQMLATWGREYGDTKGFGWIGGEVVRIAAPGLKVPHMGWNELVLDRPHPVLAGIATGAHAYFVHSFHMALDNPSDRLAHADYGGPVTAIVARGNVVGTQFHPEKSQEPGLRLLARFLRWTP